MPALSSFLSVLGVATMVLSSCNDPIAEGGDPSDAGPASSACPLADLDDPLARFVAPNGDDDGAGTLEAPWRSVGNAAATAEPGQTVFVRAGTYFEQVSVEVSGDDEAWITFAAYPGERAVIDGSRTPIREFGGVISIDDQHHIRLCGLVVQDAGPDDNAAGILVDRTHDILIAGNHTIHTVSSGIAAWNSRNVTITGNEVERACDDGEQECITVATTESFEVSDNEVHHNGPGSIGGEGIDIKDGSSHGSVTGNHVHHLQSRLGIYVEAWDKHTFDIEVSGNRVHDISGADGITLANELGGLLEDVRVFNNVVNSTGCNGILVTGNNDAIADHPMRGLEIINNTFVGNGSDSCSGNRWGGCIEIANPDAEEVLVRNNLCSGNLVYEIAVDPNLPSAQITIDHNLTHALVGEVDGETAGDDAILGDPLFEDAPSGDFHLQSASPAVGEGSPERAPERDFDGRARASSPDIGAFERDD